MFCGSCSHKEVCRYKSEYEKLLDDANSKIDMVQYPFRLSIKCCLYKADNYHPFSYNLQKEISINPPYKITSEDYYSK